MKKRILSILFIFSCLFIFACSIIKQTEIRPNAGLNYCEPLPKSFQLSDLIGSWHTTYLGSSRKDTLAIKDNGIYTQTFVNEETGYQYENIGNKWRLEFRATGEGYLHLEKMFFCGEATETCVDPQTIMGFYDACEGTWLKMEDEFILAVIGDKDADRGIGLLVLKPSGWDFYDAIYTLQGTNDEK